MVEPALLELGAGNRFSDGRDSMPGRNVLLYFAWSRAAEAGATLTVIDDRFPAVFELRRLYYPSYEHLADPATVNPGIAGFLDHIQKPNFAAFAEQARGEIGGAVREVERGADDGVITPLNTHLVADADTIVIISFDSLSTSQAASGSEVEAVRRFLSDPDHLVFVCPHHDFGEASDVPADQRQARQLAEHMHHGDRGSPPRQGFGGFARTLLASLGVPILNRFGLRPAVAADGSPAPIEADMALDDLGLLAGVETFHLHPHLPQLERLGDSQIRMNVLARQGIDLTAPPHPFTSQGRTTFDALLQSRPDAFAGRLLVCDATMFSSTAGGLPSLHRFWANILCRPQRSSAVSA